MAKNVKRKIPWKVASALLGGTLLLVGINHVRSEAQLNDLVKHKVESHGRHGYDAAKESARKERAWQLYQLWLARETRNIAPQVTPFLQDEYGPLRQSAARILGRIESPQAEAPLREALSLSEQGRAVAKGRYIPPVVLKLALGRIGSRGLKGKVKVAAVVKEVGLSFDEAVQLTGKVKQAQSKANGSEGEKIDKEVVDTLYHMGRSGENITPIMKQLGLYPSQRVLLQSSLLPQDRAVESILDYLIQLDVATPWDGELAQVYLVSSKSSVKDGIVEFLMALKAGKKQHGRRGFVALFRAAALTGDPRVLPLLKHFDEKDKNPIVHHYAMGARMNAQHIGDWSSPYAPMAPLP